VWYVVFVCLFVCLWCVCVCVWYVWYVWYVVFVCLFVCLWCLFVCVCVFVGFGCKRIRLDVLVWLLHARFLLATFAYDVATILIAN
jgi:hypothetical protein